MASVPGSTAIAEAERLLSSLKSHSGSPTDQAEVVRQLEKVRCHVHQGPDAMMFHAWPFHILPSLKILLDFGVFDLVPINSSISFEELSKAAGLDAGILFRNIRLMLTQGIFRQNAPQVIEHTPASAIFRNDQAGHFYRLGTMQFPQWWKVSDYLKAHSAAETQEATKAPYSWAMGKEGKTYYEVIEEDPVFSDAWHKGIMMNEAAQPVTGMFPFDSVRSSVKSEPHRAFLVDVGGGRGNALKAIAKEYGGDDGAKMILQDMDDVLNGKDPVKIDGVDIMPYDFFEEQPVKNAHIYLLRFCLHNHYDGRSRQILRNIVDAMGTTSRLLINEMILPTTAGPGSDPFPFIMDLNMFMESGLERTEEHWRELLGDVGLKIEKIWRHPENPVLGIIETVILRELNHSQ